MAAASSHAKLLLTLVLLQALMDSAAPACSVDAIYSFGDSIADTGNLLREGPVGFFSSIGSFPYGQTYEKPTGRCSDGLLIIDYLGNPTT
jgi:phospholipase/lecithinase/hemolysin